MSKLTQAPNREEKSVPFCVFLSQSLSEMNLLILCVYPLLISTTLSFSTTSSLSASSAKARLLGILTKSTTNWDDPVIRDPVTLSPRRITITSDPSFVNNRVSPSQRVPLYRFYDALPSDAKKITTPFDTDYVNKQDLFQNPLVSFAYERGWREGFRAAGFPGGENREEGMGDERWAMSDGR